MSKKVVFFPLLLFLVIVLVFVVQLARNAQGDDPTRLESVLVGKPVPAFRLEDLLIEGKEYDQSLLKGRPLLLNVWATWCPTCYAEHQFLNSLSEQGVVIIGLNYKDDRTQAIDWLNKYGNPYQYSLFDGDGMLGLDLGVYGAPETFFIDAQGVIRYRHVGDINADNWKSTLEPLYEKIEREAKS